MSNIFISYRRADSSGYVIAIYDRLTQKFEREQIFRDLNTIEFGVDFVEAIENAVRQCDVMLTIIGLHWLNITDDNGKRRLDDPNDFVRLEVGTGLRRDIRVIPVLVGGASMPVATELPEDLQSLVRLNAFEVNDRDFDAHITHLAETIQHLVVSHKQVNLWTAHLPDNLPQPFEWCEIPSGETTVEFPGDRGKQTFDVPRFFISKHPITNAQWDVFAQDNDGYANRRWWEFSDPAKQWRDRNPCPKSHEMAWGDHPKIHVTWFEALAFCNWLSDKTGLSIILPSEQQWQWSAQGTDRWVFPWGDSFDTNKANIDGSGIDKTTIVTQYAQYPSPFGALDMGGNVFEWCLPEVIDIVTKLNRVPVRGASYRSIEYFARCTSRQTYQAGLADTDLGFRIVCIKLDD